MVKMVTDSGSSGSAAALGVHHEHGRPAVFDAVRHLTWHPPAVEADGDRAEGLRGPERNDPLRGVRRENADPVAFGDPVLVAQGRGQRSDGPSVFGVGDAAVGGDEIVGVSPVQGLRK
jgi:hypothetical protein